MNENTENKHFRFGANWKGYISSVDEDRIQSAEKSMAHMIGERDLSGKTFIDAGCGSGLFSLAAQRMGARVLSFDVDQDCIDCTEDLKKRFGSGGPNWKIEKASVLDEKFLANLGSGDIVYSWGVLHHTGNMKKAIELVSKKVKTQGLLYIAIANDQGSPSRHWHRVKKVYNHVPRVFQFFIVLGIALLFELKSALGKCIRGKNPFSFLSLNRVKKERGMSVWHDWVDWCGGYPFEVAKPEDIIVPLKSHGFVLENLRTHMTGWGCNEYVFRKTGQKCEPSA